MGCVIQVIGKKDTGKTSAIERAVKELVRQGYRVAVIKHSHHEIDLQGKDTFRFWSAGAEIVTFHDSKCVTFHKCTLDMLSLLPVDVVIIEGFKDLNLGYKIEIKSPEEVDIISKLIVEESRKCQKVEAKIVIDGKESKVTNEYALLLYNLMRFLNIREVKIED